MTSSANNERRMKIAFLWTGLSGYMNACLKELSGRDGIDLLVSHQMPSPEAPFDAEQFAWISGRISWRSESDLVDLERKLI